jgi:hypothetical protein
MSFLDLLIISPINAKVFDIEIEASDCVLATLIPLEIIYWQSHLAF